MYFLLRWCGKKFFMDAKRKINCKRPYTGNPKVPIFFIEKASRKTHMPQLHITRFVLKISLASHRSEEKIIVKHCLERSGFDTFLMKILSRYSPSSLSDQETSASAQNTSNDTLCLSRIDNKRGDS